MVSDRRWRRWATTALAAALLGLAGVISANGRGVAGADPATAHEPTRGAVTVRVSDRPASRPLPAGFLGFSVEFGALHTYLGADPAAPNPVFLQLLKSISQGHQPILRVGGNSTDETWLPLPGRLPPAAVGYPLTPDWLATVAALVRASGARLILGVNLAADDPAFAAAEARAFTSAVGRRAIAALEVGNEPDLYSQVPWYRLAGGAVITRRPAPYPFTGYAADLRHWRAALPHLPLAVGALATLSWLPDLVALAPRLGDVNLVTAHRYALSNCGVAPGSPTYPTLANLFSPAATSGLAAGLAPSATAVHAEGLTFRVDELNTASCEGAPGISDRFASALWIVDTLFDLAGAGVDGVNVHTLPGAHYAPFSFAESGGHWSAHVNPLLYGLLFFASAFPPGAHMLAVTDLGATTPGHLKAFSTLGPDRTLRTTLINEDAAGAVKVTLTEPGRGGPLREEILVAHSLSATAGVRLGGRSFASPTRTGTLAAPRTIPVPLGPHGYTVTVPPASAVLLSRTL